LNPVVVVAGICYCSYCSLDWTHAYVYRGYALSAWGYLVSIHIDGQLEMIEFEHSMYVYTYASLDYGLATFYASMSHSRTTFIRWTTICGVLWGITVGV